MAKILRCQFPAIVAYIFICVPALMEFVLVLVLVLSSIAMFITSIPGFFAFIHITAVQFVLPLILVFLMWVVLAKQLDTHRGNGSDSRLARWTGLTFDKHGITDDGVHFVAYLVPLSAVLMHFLAQLIQGLGIITWTWYLTWDYERIHEAYWDAFALPPLSWDFNVAFFVDEIQFFFRRVFSFQLEDFDIFPVALGVQVLTLAAGLLYHGSIRLLTKCFVRIRRKSDA